MLHPRVIIRVESALLDRSPVSVGMKPITPVTPSRPLPFPRATGTEGGDRQNEEEDRPFDSTLHHLITIALYRYKLSNRSSPKHERERENWMDLVVERAQGDNANRVGLIIRSVWFVNLTRIKSV